MILGSLLVVTACGALRILDGQTARKPSSFEADPEALLQELDDKLNGLYFYQVLAQKQLKQFDQSIQSTPLNEIYESSAYLKLQANRAQVDEIEHEIIDSMKSLNGNHKNQQHQKVYQKILLKLMHFSRESHFKSLAMENLLSKLKQKSVISKQKSFSLNSLESEYENLSRLPQFQVHEKNIEHLSYMMEGQLETNEARFKPSADRAGNITGFEFPAKVWSLTFDDGPKKETTLIILENLKKHNLKATFFQLTSLARANPEVGEAIRNAGMELASHSYTHQELTKVGATTLEKEITTAVKELSEHHQRPIKFFRLPYGAGVNSPGIRQKIADNQLIHVFWNIDTLDWMAQTPDKIVARTLALMKKTSRDQGILLFHDVHQRTVEATPKIMEFLKQENRRVCTLEQIVQDMNEGQSIVCPQK